MAEEGKPSPQSKSTVMSNSHPTKQPHLGEFIYALLQKITPGKLVDCLLSFLGWGTQCSLPPFVSRRPGGRTRVQTGFEDQSRGSIFACRNNPSSLLGKDFPDAAFGEKSTHTPEATLTYAL